MARHNRTGVNGTRQDSASNKCPVELLERAAHGERLIITHDGKGKAEIGPAEEAAIRRARQAAETIRELRKTILPLGIPLEKAIGDGRA